MDLKNKRVLVIGMGTSGVSAVRYALGAQASVLACNQGDFASWGQACVLRELAQQNSRLSFVSQEKLVFHEGVDLIVLSPGIARESDFLAPWMKAKVPVVNEIEMAFWRWQSEGRGPIISLTGSNGKTTTTLLVEYLLKKRGLKVFAGGNLGLPFCEVFLKPELADTEVAVLELSSFQLESLFAFHSESQALLNLSFTHGERYQNVVDYAQAKFRLSGQRQNEDLMVTPCLKKVVDSKALDALKKWQGSLEGNICAIPCSKDELRAELDHFYDLASYPLVGEHNLENLWVAHQLVNHIYGSKEKQRLDDFTGAHHRLEKLMTVSGRLILNDAKSTNWQATLTALEAIAEFGASHLILGGQVRGHNDDIRPYYDQLKKRISKLWLFGQSGERIFRELQSLGQDFECFYARDLSEVLEHLKKERDQRPILFSPAFPSFDQFKDYNHRGETFKGLVRELLF